MNKKIDEGRNTFFPPSAQFQLYFIPVEMSISMLLMSEKRERLSKNLCTHAGFSLRNKFTECVYESSS